MNSIERNGIPSAISKAALAAAIRPGKRITVCESRYQKPSDVAPGVALGTPVQERRRE